MSSPPPTISSPSETYLSGSDELPKRIIVPLDGSDFSFRAAKYAINLAKVTGGEIICVHSVIELPYTEYMGVGTLTVSSYMNEIKKQTEQWASQVRAMADAKGGVKTTADTIFNITSVAESIISYADEQRADLIVMGTRGRAGLKRLVLGSVASGVVEHATCPVLVVR